MKPGLGLAWPQLLSSPTDRLAHFMAFPQQPHTQDTLDPGSKGFSANPSASQACVPWSTALAQNPRQAGQVFSSLTIPCPMQRSCFNKRCQSRWPRSCRGLLAGCPGTDAEEVMLASSMNACLLAYKGGLSDLGPGDSRIAWIYLKPEQLGRELRRGRL